MWNHQVRGIYEKKEHWSWGPIRNRKLGKVRKAMLDKGIWSEAKGGREKWMSISYNPHFRNNYNLSVGD